MRKSNAANPFFMTPVVVLGNLVWPALYAETKITSLPVIALGLILELFVIRALFNRSWKVSSIMVIAANLVSGLIGYILRPLSGLAWEVSVGPLLMRMFDWGTFNPVAWFFVPIIGGGINAVLELSTVTLVWKEKFSLKNLLVLWAINWTSVGIATLWVIISPSKM